MNKRFVLIISLVVAGLVLFTIAYVLHDKSHVDVSIGDDTRRVPKSAVQIDVDGVSTPLMSDGTFQTYNLLTSISSIGGFLCLIASGVLTVMTIVRRAKKPRSDST